VRRRRPGAGLQGLPGRRHEDQPVEREVLDGVLRQQQVSHVGRIE